MGFTRIDESPVDRFKIFFPVLVEFLVNTVLLKIFVWFHYVG